MFEATVARNGQVTIPAGIRRAMGLSAGVRVVFTRLEDGTTVMRAKSRSLNDLKGLLKPAAGKRKVAIKGMSIGAWLERC